MSFSHNAGTEVATTMQVYITPKYAGGRDEFYYYYQNSWGSAHFIIQGLSSKVKYNPAHSPLHSTFALYIHSCQHKNLIMTVPLTWYGATHILHRVSASELKVTKPTVNNNRQLSYYLSQLWPLQTLRNRIAQNNLTSLLSYPLKHHHSSTRHQLSPFSCILKLQSQYPCSPTSTENTIFKHPVNRRIA